MLQRKQLVAELLVEAKKILSPGKRLHWDKIPRADGLEEQLDNPRNNSSGIPSRFRFDKSPSGTQRRKDLGPGLGDSPGMRGKPELIDSIKYHYTSPGK